jgi:hypothetical protein
MQSAVDVAGWAALAGVATALLGVVVGVFVVWWQLRRQWLINSANAVTDLADRWTSPEWRAYRQHCARAIRRHLNGEPVDLAEDFQILGLFEHMGLLVRRRVLDREMLWSKFGWYITRYHLALTCNESLIDANRSAEGDATLWEEFEWLNKEMLHIYALRGVAIKDARPARERIEELLKQEERLMSYADLPDRGHTQPNQMSAERLTLEEAVGSLAAGATLVACQVVETRDEMMRTLARSFNVVPASDGDLSIVQGGDSRVDLSRASGQFDFHLDGLYMNRLPHWVLLACEDPGSSTTFTRFADSTQVIKQLDKEILDVLAALAIVYVSKSGDAHRQPLVGVHPTSGEPALMLGSRAYVELDPQLAGGVANLPTIREVTDAMVVVFAAVEASVVQEIRWQRGDAVLFDNYRYLHARWGKAPDPERRLRRVWLDDLEPATTQPQVAGGL